MPSPDKLIDIHLTGDWERVILGMSAASDEVLKGYEEAVNKFSRKILKIVKGAIQTSTPPGGEIWEPLSPKYLRSYGKHDPYFLTGQYYRAVGLFKQKSKVWVGLPYNRKYNRHDSHSLTLNQIAILLEYGRGGLGSNYVEDDDEGEGGYDNSTSYMPARPLWAPSLREAGGIDKLNEMLLHYIRSSLGRAFGISANQVKLSKMKSPYRK